MTVRDPEIRTTVLEALQSKRGLNVTFRDREGRVSSRAILPFIVYERYGVEYVRAYCWLRKEDRDFTLRGILRGALRDKKVPNHVYKGLQASYRRLAEPLPQGWNFVACVNLEKED